VRALHGFGHERPRGILWDHLQPPQIREIPILERMGYA